MSTTTAVAPSHTQGMFGMLDEIDTVAASAFAGIKQYTSGTRQLVRMLGGIQPNGTGTVVAAPAAAVIEEPAVSNVPDATAIVGRGKKKTAAKKGGRGRKPNAAPASDTTPAAAAAPTGDQTGESAEAGQPSLRSVCFSILSRPENAQNGLKAGGDGPSVLKTIIDEKLWVSKKNGNMPALISQCLNTLKKDGKITRNSETHCFIAKPGTNLD